MTEQQEQRPGASTEPPRVNAESWGRCGHRPHLPMTANRHTHAGEFASCYDDHSSARAGAVSTEATPPAEQAAAEWHRYLHAEGILVDEDPTVTECGPWHHRVFLDGPGMASTEATLPDHDCVEPSACGVTGFYCYNSRRASTEATPPHYNAEGDCIRAGCEWHDGYRAGLHDAAVRASTEATPPCHDPFCKTPFECHRTEDCLASTEASERPDLRAALDPEDVRAVLNQHESECSYYEGGDFTCSCGYDEAVDRVDAWLDAYDAALTGASPSELSRPVPMSEWEPDDELAGANRETEADLWNSDR